MYKTFSYRIKDSTSSKHLLKMSRAINFVWNFCNETQKFALSHNRSWPSWFIFNHLTAGSSKELGISATSIEQVSKEYVQKRTQFKKPFLRWRSNRKSLPWIPFTAIGIQINRSVGTAKFSGLPLDLWYHRPIEGEIKSGSITADSRGRWYLNVVCKLPDPTGPVDLTKDVGVDLGLKDVLTTSDGLSVGAARYYRRMENRLAKAQHAKKKKTVKRIHAKIKNQRKDFNHKLSKQLTDNYNVIYIGDVNSTELIKNRPNLAKSVLDASWYQLKSFVSYKALANGGFALEVSERYSTQICSECGSISSTSPKGISGLSTREWTCSDCGTTHSRDVNAAKNILSFGRETLQKLRFGKTKAGRNLH